MTQENSPAALQKIGQTPLVRLRHIDTGLCELFLKLESENPGGSIKDRIALSMITAAEAEGRLQTGSILVEATAGNTGIGLAVVAVQKGYRLKLVIPDKMSSEKVARLKELGAEIIMTRSDVSKGHPEYYQDMAKKLADETPNAFYVNQFENPHNPSAHETTTGPEILHQMNGKVDAVVCGVGTGGTLTGLGRFFRENGNKVEMILADPKGSVLAPYVRDGVLGECGSWLVEGIGEDFIPLNCDLSLVAEAFTITDQESFATARDVLAKENISCGMSSGTMIAAALKYCRVQTVPKRVVTFVCDSGKNYASKLFNAQWLRDNNIDL